MNAIIHKFVDKGRVAFTLWLAVLGVSLFFTIKRSVFIYTATEGVAVVSETIRRFVGGDAGGRSGYVARPTIRLTLPGGVVHTRESSWASSSFDVPEATPVPVVYNEEDPAGFRVKWFWDLWLWPFALWLLSGVATLGLVVQRGVQRLHERNGRALRKV